MNSTFTTIMRILLALVLIFFGLNKFIGFLEMPTMPADAEAFMSSLNNTHYILPAVAILEIFIGLLLLIKRWIGFALVLLAPISVNILLFHIFLDLPGIGGAALVAILNGILIYKYWPKFRTLFE